MAASTVSPKIFAREAKRRLIDTHELMIELGLRHRSSVYMRVRAGTLPAPLYSRDRSIALWDRDALPTPDRKEQT